MGLLPAHGSQPDRAGGPSALADDAVDRVEQLRQRANGADEKPQDLFHAQLARTTNLAHRLAFLPVLPEIIHRVSAGAAIRHVHRIVRSGGQADHLKSKGIAAGKFTGCRPTWEKHSHVSIRSNPLSRAGHILAIVGAVLLSWLAGFPRRLGDRLFAANDAEAYWRDWQITRTCGGLGRRYRDPRFDTLAGCPTCAARASPRTCPATLAWTPAAVRAAAATEAPARTAADSQCPGRRAGHILATV